MSRPRNFIHSGERETAFWIFPANEFIRDRMGHFPFDLVVATQWRSKGDGWVEDPDHAQHLEEFTLCLGINCHWVSAATLCSVDPETKRRYRRYITSAKQPPLVVDINHTDLANTLSDNTLRRLYGIVRWLNQSDPHLDTGKLSRFPLNALRHLAEPQNLDELKRLFYPAYDHLPAGEHTGLSYDDVEPDDVMRPVFSELFREHLEYLDAKPDALSEFVFGLFRRLARDLTERGLFRACWFCLKPFKAGKVNQRFCTNHCKDAARHRRERILVEAIVSI